MPEPLIKSCLKLFVVLVEFGIYVLIMVAGLVLIVFTATEFVR